MRKRVISPYTVKALEVLGKMIQLKRKERALTLKQLANRAGVSRSLIQRLEKCEPGCEIGVAFEVAHLLGIELFESHLGLYNLASSLTDKISLLPGSVRESIKKVSNDF